MPLFFMYKLYNLSSKPKYLMMKGDAINNYAVIVLRNSIYTPYDFAMFGRGTTGLIDCTYYWA